MKCTACSYENQTGTQFCVNCGAKLGSGGDSPIQKCTNGHIFSSELSECPHCPRKRSLEPKQKGKTQVIDHSANQERKGSTQEIGSYQQKQAGGKGKTVFEFTDNTSQDAKREESSSAISQQSSKKTVFLNQENTSKESSSGGRQGNKVALISRYGASQLAGFLVSYNFLDDKFGTFWPIRVGRNSIGRDDDCTIQIEASNVSRQHAKLIIRDRGNGYLIWIEDNGSQVGTYHNNEEIGLDKVALKNGDKIKIGPVEFVVILVPKPS